MPGDSLSVSEAMKERTPENGYELAGEFLSGETRSSRIVKMNPDGTVTVIRP